MKYFIFCILFISSALAAPSFNKFNFKSTIERKLSDSAKEILEKFRELIYAGNPDKDVPILDPYKLDTFDFVLDTQPLSVTVKAENGVLTGLGEFEINNIDMPPSADQITFDGTLPLTVIHAEKYSLRGLVFGALPIYGNGVAHFEIGNFYFTGKAGVAEGPNGVYLTDIHLVLNLETFTSETTGMLGGGEVDDLINALMADLAPEFFNNNSELISEMISDVILDKINEVFDGLSLDELIDIIS